MGGVNMEIYRGDIFYIEKKYDSYGSEQREGRPALVVSNNTGNHFSEIVSVVWLTTAEKKPLPTHCEVMSKVPSTALCEQVITISQSRLGNYIRTATDAEMKEVDKCLMISLGLNPDVTCNEDDSQIDDLKTKLEKVTAKYENEKSICDSLQKELAETADELETTQAKLEDKSRELEDHHRHLEHMQEVIHDFKRRGTQHNEVLEKENRTLKIKIELLEEQNERLLDRLIG